MVLYRLILNAARFTKLTQLLPALLRALRRVADCLSPDPDVKAHFFDRDELFDLLLARPHLAQALRRLLEAQAPLARLPAPPAAGPSLPPAAPEVASRAMVPRLPAAAPDNAAPAPEVASRATVLRLPAAAPDNAPDIEAHPPAADLHLTEPVLLS